MSTHTFLCPACRAELDPAAADLDGRVRCGICGTKVSAPPVLPSRPKAPPAAAPGESRAAPAPPPDDRPADANANTYKAKGVRTAYSTKGRLGEADVDQMAEEPAPRPRRRRERDPDRPARRKTSRVATTATVGLVVGGVIVLGLVVGGVYALVEAGRTVAKLKVSPESAGPAPAAPVPAAPVPAAPARPIPVGPALSDLPLPPNKPPAADPGAPAPRAEPRRVKGTAPAAVPARPVKLPAVRPVPLTPPALASDRVEVKLPAAADDVCAAGGGRYLVFHLPQPRQLAVFDVSAAKVTKYLPLPADEVRIAGGMNKLFVGFPESNAVARYDLETFEKEVTAPLTVEGKLARIVLGSASAGPLVVCTGDYARGGKIAGLYDPVGFRKFDAEWEKGAGWPTLTPSFLRASADGTTFAFHDGFGGEPHALKTMILTGSRVKGGAVWPAGASIGVPGPDGKSLYCANGVFTPLDMKKVLPKDAAGGSYLPSTDPSLFLRLEPGANGKAGGLTVYTVGDDRPLAKLTGIDGVKAEEVGYGSARDPFHHDKRVHFVPQANVIVAVPPGNDRLVLHRFDLDAALEKSGVDYLFVTSRPPAAVPGEKFEYRIGVKSKKGGVKYKLESGPDGLTVSADGKVSWAVPEEFTGPAAVIVTVSDAAGQETFHTFNLAAADGK